MKYKVKKSDLNMYGTLHGGRLMHLVDDYCCKQVNKRTESEFVTKQFICNFIAPCKVNEKFSISMFDFTYFTENTLEVDFEFETVDRLIASGHIIFTKRKKK